MDLSKRANLLGVTEIRGMVRPTLDPSFTPTQVVESDWTPLVRADIESEDSEFWRYVGQASVADHPYVVRDAYGEFQETMRAGFLTKTLSEDPAVMLNFMHEPLTTMAMTRGGGLTLSASPHLDVLGMIPKSDVDAQRIMPKVQRGVATSMSLAFRVTDQIWNEDYTERIITGINLHRGDVASIVTGLGANPAAWGTVRSGLTVENVRRFLESQTAAELGALVDGLESDGWFVGRNFRTNGIVAPVSVPPILHPGEFTVGARADEALLAMRAGTASPDQITMLAGLVCSSIDMADDAFDTFLSALGISDPDAAEDANEQNSGLDSEFLKELVAVQLRCRDESLTAR